MPLLLRSLSVGMVFMQWKPEHIGVSGWKVQWNSGRSSGVESRQLKESGLSADFQGRAHEGAGKNLLASVSTQNNPVVDATAGGDIQGDARLVGPIAEGHAICAAGDPVEYAGTISRVGIQRGF